MSAGNVVVMIGNMFENECTKCDVADCPAIGSRSIRGCVRTREGTVEISAETALVDDDTESAVPFFPVPLFFI
jgi:hypothetical protein